MACLPEDVWTGTFDIVDMKLKNIDVAAKKREKNMILASRDLLMAVSVTEFMYLCLPAPTTKEVTNKR